MKKTESVNVRGHVKASQVLIKANGEEIVQRVIRSNLIVNVGRNWLRDLFLLGDAKYIDWISIGDDKVIDTVSAEDTTLGNELKRWQLDPGEKEQVAGQIGQARINYTVDGDEFGSLTLLKDIGLFLSDASATLDSGTMFSRVELVADSGGYEDAGLFVQPIDGNGDKLSIVVEWTITF